MIMSYIQKQQSANCLRRDIMSEDSAQQCLDLFEEQDTLNFCSLDTQQDLPQLVAPDDKSTFVVFSQGCFIINTREKLMEYLDSFMQSICSGPVMRQFRSQLSFFNYRRESFLYLLAENCYLLLEESRVGQLLISSTIYTAIMMIDPERYELSANGRRVNTRRLIQK